MANDTTKHMRQWKLTVRPDPQRADPILTVVEELTGRIVAEPEGGYWFTYDEVREMVARWNAGTSTDGQPAHPEEATTMANDTTKHMRKWKLTMRPDLLRADPVLAVVEELTGRIVAEPEGGYWFTDDEMREMVARWNAGAPAQDAGE